ncbi:NUDIX hydrolase [Tenacibaculum holothuriorum]|uniref:NUDIX hydrolase n=1 Tax=Tenacibaculum holothuriorum TaxID=1635173 RepID=A0A1Y2PDW2_9FLAO|nr:NUDIX hydrolase [Tenacibaculum holothuriorum]OSY87919.1 NUDIX hydrolase [Tenacibaculum holothuriorum]
MYKVFVNDKPIILTSSLKKEEAFPTYIYKTTSLDEIIYKLRLGKHKGIHLYSTSLEKDWTDFKNAFKTISAAGGLVLNNQNEILFIYRGTKWDLPKGRIEKGESIEETAIREVEEECGITNVSIDQFLITTYHLFLQQGEHRLKETHWYLMNSTYKGELTPQLEEGITDVAFKNEKDTIEALGNTYANIRLVHDSYKNV